MRCLKSSLKRKAMKSLENSLDDEPNKIKKNNHSPTLLSRIKKDTPLDSFAFAIERPRRLGHVWVTQKPNSKIPI